MLTKRDFINIALNDKDYQAASKIAAKYGAEITVFSYSPNVVKSIIGLYGSAQDTDLLALIDLVKTANDSMQDIETLIKAKNGITQKTERLNKFFDAFESPMHKRRLYILMGGSGVGKTFELMNRYPDLKIWNCHKQLEVMDLLYSMKTIGGQLIIEETNFLKAMRDGGKAGLDEINECPPSTLDFFRGISDGKQYIEVGSETIKIHPNFKMIATMNAPSETDERAPLGDAFLSRAIGCVYKLTKEEMSYRLSQPVEWINRVEKLYTFIQTSGLNDVRNLTFRDLQAFCDPFIDFETQLEFKLCVNDSENEVMLEKIKESGEFQLLLRNVFEVQRNRK